MARGVEACDGAQIGVRSAAQLGVARYTRSGDDTGLMGQDRDCVDFGAAAEAQRFFLASGGPARDPHDLDGDGDGLACEWGTEDPPHRVATGTEADARPRASRDGAAEVERISRATPGRRGGTYTITSGGTKDYDGLLNGPSGMRRNGPPLRRLACARFPRSGPCSIPARSRTTSWIMAHRGASPDQGFRLVDG